MGADISHFKHSEIQHQNGTKATKASHPELVIVPSPDHPSPMPSSSSSTSSAIADIKKVTKSHSSYTHFSDYSMFPDRFNAASCKPVAIVHPGHGHEHEEQPHFSDSLYPDHHKMKMHRSLSETPPGGGGQIDLKSGTSLPNSGFISKYNFRLRRNSESDHHETPESESTEGYRPRSLSNSKMYYFDFSLIPDKDPHRVIDERRKHYSDDKVLPTVREGTSAPVQTTLGHASKRSRKTSEGRFGFFDFSMIPDKDPKCFTCKKE